LVGRIALCLALLCAPQGALACRLALVLALDVSSSVDAGEDALQRGGLARALLDSDVQDAFFVSPDPVALMIYEWSGRYNQAKLMDWTMIEDRDDLAFASDKVSRSPRSHNDFPTALGYALGYAATEFQSGPDCLFRTIDMSGDGINNDGFGPAEAYAAFPLDDVTVNGLVIHDPELTAEVDLISFYETEVIKGPGAFVEVAQGFEDYARAIRRKLIRELSAQVIGAIELDVYDPG